MLILSNCLTDTADEGCLKVANSLAKRIKRAGHGVTVVSYRRQSKITDIFLEVNKYLLSRDLAKLLQNRREPVLYIPFPTSSLAAALRLLILSVISPQKPNVILIMTLPYGTLSKALLRLSKGNLFALSAESTRFYENLVGKDRVTYLKTGVDTKRFAPVLPQQVTILKQKYGLDPNRKTVLHVGHMKAGRNVAELMKLDRRYQVVLVVSTFTSQDQERDLRKQLENCGNITIFDSYLPNIEEIYQLADVYLFPVQQTGNCIDVPLSCLEAASCGKPVISTRYGEMREFEGKDGFYFIDKMDQRELNRLVELAVNSVDSNPRNAVLEYDWDRAVNKLLEL